MLAWVASAWALERWGRSQKIPSSAPDLIVVAGCAVQADGTPSPALRRRVLASISLPFGEVPLLFTGGGEPSEAEVAAHLARASGIPEERLLLEPHAESTWENAIFSARLLKLRGMDPRQLRVLVVSDAVHLLRCFLLFRRVFGTVEVFAAPGPDRWKLALREVLVLGWYALRGRLRRSA